MRYFHVALYTYKPCVFLVATTTSLAVYSRKRHTLPLYEPLSRPVHVHVQQPGPCSGWRFGALIASRFPQLPPRTVVYCCQIASSYIYSLHGSREVNVKPVRQRPLIRYGHMTPHTTLVCQHVNVSTVIIYEAYINVHRSHNHSSPSSSSSAINFSTSSAAMQPLPALVIACR